MSVNTPGAIYLKPGARPQRVPVPNGLSDIKDYTEGYIEALYHWVPEHPRIFAYGNDEARLLGMPPNLYRRADSQAIVGPLIFVADDGEGGERALTEDEERALLAYIERNQLVPAAVGQRVAYDADNQRAHGVVQDLVVDDDNFVLAVIQESSGTVTRVPVERICYNEGWYPSFPFNRYLPF